MGDHPATLGSTPPQTPASAYAEAASDADARIDEELANLRRRSDNGEISQQQAAGERIALMENHLQRIQSLRQIYFGDAGDGGWNSGTCTTN